MTDDTLVWTPLPPCKIRIFQIHLSPDSEHAWQSLDSNELQDGYEKISRKKRHFKGLKKQKTVENYSKKNIVAEMKKEGVEGVKLKSLDVIPVPQLSKGGWYSTEISMPLKELVYSASGTFDILLGVRFEGPRGKPIIPERFLRDPKDNTSSSFIVISSEAQNPAEQQTLKPENARIISELFKLEENEEVLNEINTDDDFAKPKKNRHNHKTVNPLKISYDTNTDSIIPKKWINDRVKRSLRDNTLPDQSYEVNKRPIELNQALPDENEKPGENDLGDTLYFEPDVFVHEKLVPTKYRSFDETDDPFANDEGFGTTNEEVEVEPLTVKPEHKKYLENNRWSYGKEVNGHVKYRHRKKRIDEPNVPKKRKVLKSQNSKNDKYKYATDSGLDKDGGFAIDVDLIKSASDNKTTTKRTESKDLNSILNDNAGMLNGNDIDEAIDFGKIQANTESTVEMTTRKRKQRRKPNVSKGAAHPTLVDDWKLWDNDNWIAKPVTSGPSCKKKHFQISFTDLGWGDWIIAPDNFSMNYCSGHCQLSSLLNMASSNHAILQYLINSIDRGSGVPPPCCVPAKMTSKTVLYQDPNGNVMLRNYPNMVVTSCECR